MNDNETEKIWDDIERLISKFGPRVSSSGVRYGSVIYFGFGEVVKLNDRKGRKIERRKIEIDVGCDDWKLMKSDKFFLKSNFFDVNEARDILYSLSKGIEFVRFYSDKEYLNILFTNDVILKANLCAESASGFFLSISCFDGPSYESLDGRTFEFRL